MKANVTAHANLGQENDASDLAGTRAIREAYGSFARPRTAEVLKAIGIDVVYHRASGDNIYYRDSSGHEVRVLDFLGGFGATLFGHNHPDLVGALCDALKSGVPTHAQASSRRYAALLAARLSARAGRVTGKSYVVTLSSSGAEAVEAAIKHAEMEALVLAEGLVTQQRTNVALARMEVAAGRISLAQIAGADPRAADADEYLAMLEREAEEACAEPAVAIALVRGFHGKTLGSLRLTHNPEYRAVWERGGLVEFVDPGDPDALTRAVEKHSRTFTAVTFDDLGHLTTKERRRIAISGFFIEPIQGEGGIRPVPAAFLKRARELADETGVPLVFDEIQCGMGRTGTFFASEASGVAADYYVLSKSLGGGLSKIGATLVAADRYQRDFGYLHTSTFAEDDPGCYVALAALDLLEADDDALIRGCAAKGDHLLARLRELLAQYPDVFADVRGKGLLVGLELAPQLAHPSPMVKLLSEQNLLGFVAAGFLLHEAQIRVAPTLSAHGTIRMAPSAYVSTAALDQVCEALGRFAEVLRSGDAASLLSFCVSDEVSPPARSRAIAGPPSLRSAVLEPTDANVAFLAHFRDGGDVQLFDPAFEAFSPEACEDFISRVAPLLAPLALAKRIVRSPTGASTTLHIVGIPFTANQASEALRAQKTSALLEMVRAGVEFGRASGATMVGCGGYTSIVTDNCRDLATAGLGVTSGNSLTVAAAAEAIQRAAAEANLKHRVLGVVGAAGNIGAALAELASEHADSVVLVGRPAAARRLQRVAATLRVPARIATDLAALRDCTMIVSASNAPTPVIHPEHIGDQPVVICDVAVPRDVHPRVAALRPNARIIRGGIVRLPLDQSIDVPALGLPRGRVYACLGESILLSLSGKTENFSFGPIRSERVREVSSLAKHHGFAIDIEEWDPTLHG